MTEQPLSAPLPAPNPSGWVSAAGAIGIVLGSLSALAVPCTFLLRFFRVRPQDQQGQG